MRGLTASELLEVWERGRSQQPAGRAMVMLAAAHRDQPPEDLAARTVGERDGSLLDLHALTFGPHLTGLVECPGCGQRLEVSLRRDELRTEAGPVGDRPAGRSGSLVVGRDGYEVRFRPPTAGDLLAVTDRPGPHAARAALLERCTESAVRGGTSVPLDELPERVVEAVADGMAQADPGADLRLDLTCPSCGHRWESAFDPASFLWDTVEAWARRLVREVHALASAYGWGESDILAMTPSRRRLYLEMAGST